MQIFAGREILLQPILICAFLFEDTYLVYIILVVHLQHIDVVLIEWLCLTLCYCAIRSQSLHWLCL